MNWSIIVIFSIFFGLILLLIEVFLIPGFGVVGVSGLILIIGGIYIAWTKLSSVFAVSITMSTVISVVILVVFLLKSNYTKRIVLNKSIEDGKKMNTLNELSNRGEDMKGGVSLREGMLGLAKSDLRPVGIADFDGRRLSVLTDGTYIESGTKIKIIKIEGRKLFVEAV